jgi:hypothetical protein
MTDAESDTQQASIDPFREMNRYDDRDEDWPSAAVFEEPRRTLGNYWRKFHAARDCGTDNVRFVENTTTRPISEEYEYRLYCWNCRHEVPEDEVLFVGGDWYSEHGWLHYERPLEDLFIPDERVLDLGPDPDREELAHALNLCRIEREAGPHVGGPIRPEQWRACEDCGHDVPLRFDDRCRMCYDGEWTGRMQQSLVAYERKIREWHNHSFVHRLEHKVDPLSVGGKPGEGEVLYRRHAREGTTKLVIVTKRLEDLDDGHREYELTDPTYTRYWQYREEDLADCFWSTGLYDRHSHGVDDEEIRQAYQHVCDHSFSEVHDPETHAVAGEQCIHCKTRRGVEDDR